MPTENLVVKKEILGVTHGSFILTVLSLFRSEDKPDTYETSKCKSLSITNQISGMDNVIGG